MEKLVIIQSLVLKKINTSIKKTNIIRTHNIV